MTRTVEQIIAEARSQSTPFGPMQTAVYARAARELANEHGMTVARIAIHLRVSETRVRDWLNNDVWIRLGERHAR
jgi:DNA invertase Pin-like site-specific DNA recombinase